MRPLHWPGPLDALVIQLGENTFPAQKGVVLSHSIAADLETLHSCFPDTCLIWSSFLRHCEWHKVISPHRVDLARRKTHKTVACVVESFSGCIIGHPDRQPTVCIYPNGAWIFGFTALEMGCCVGCGHWVCH